MTQENLKKKDIWLWNKYMWLWATFTFLIMFLLKPTLVIFSFMMVDISLGFTF